MTKLVLLVDWLLKRSLMLLMAAIVLVVCWQVLSRFVLTNPSSMTEEIARCLLLWIAMLGAAYAYRTGQHLGLDIVTSRMTPLWQHRIAFVLTAAVVVFSSIVMVWGAANWYGLPLS
ncbi:TRAP transporter small permease subunit [Rheinheimera sp. KL1]|uniref:TRAP transporter small permease n=1 Tax=Rheinheimera sp. KL1 TaxID=1635005 RepID=UPI000A50D60D|nr:TRAP transporter small permease subunit [Rheinheimera sp. KL1]